MLALNRWILRFWLLPSWLRGVVIVQLILLVWLQMDLWLGYGGVSHLVKMKNDIQDQRVENNRLRIRNTQLSQEIQTLKQGPNVIEERARLDLGMVKDNESFFLWID